MPIKKSAIKRAKQNIVARDRNRALKRAFRLDIKNIVKDLAAKKVDEAIKEVPAAYKALDKAAKTGVIHRNTAARKKSRLMKKVNEALEKGGITLATKPKKKLKDAKKAAKAKAVKARSASKKASARKTAKKTAKKAAKK